METAIGFIFFVVFLAVIALSINAGLLMLAARLAGVRGLTFGRAVIIVIVAGIVVAIAQYLLAWAVAAVAVGSQVAPDSLAFALIVISLAILVTMFVNAQVFSVMLPSTYIKGLIVYILHIAMIIAIVFSIVLILSVIGIQR